MNLFADIQKPSNFKVVKKSWMIDTKTNIRILHLVLYFPVPNQTFRADLSAFQPCNISLRF